MSLGGIQRRYELGIGCHALRRHADDLADAGHSQPDNAAGVFDQHFRRPNDVAAGDRDGTPGVYESADRIRDVSGQRDGRMRKLLALRGTGFRDGHDIHGYADAATGL